MSPAGLMGNPKDINRPVLGPLGLLGDEPGVVFGGLNFLHPPGRGLAGEGRGVSKFLKLVLGEEPAVGQSGPDILQVDDALDLGLEGLADLVQQGGQGAIVGGLLDPGTGSADLGNLFEVCFQGICHASPKSIMPRVKAIG